MLDDPSQPHQDKGVGQRGEGADCRIKTGPVFGRNLFLHPNVFQRHVHAKRPFKQEHEGDVDAKRADLRNEHAHPGQHGKRCFDERRLLPALQQRGRHEGSEREHAHDRDHHTADDRRVLMKVLKQNKLPRQDEHRVWNREQHVEPGQPPKDWMRENGNDLFPSASVFLPNSPVVVFAHDKRHDGNDAQDRDGQQHWQGAGGGEKHRAQKQDPDAHGVHDAAQNRNDCFPLFERVLFFQLLIVPALWRSAKERVARGFQNGGYHEDEKVFGYDERDVAEHEHEQADRARFLAADAIRDHSRRKLENEQQKVLDGQQHADQPDTDPARIQNFHERRSVDFVDRAIGEQNQKVDRVDFFDCHTFSPLNKYKKTKEQASSVFM